MSGKVGIELTNYWSLPIFPSVSSTKQIHLRRGKLLEFLALGAVAVDRNPRWNKQPQHDIVRP